MISGFSMLIFFILFALPQLAAAQTQGLVACTGLDCNFCTLIETANRVINLFFEILVIVAIIMIVRAGFILVISAGNVSAMENAKSSLTNVIIGFVIILSAWLIVDTVFKVLVTNQDFGMWNEFNANTDCGSIRNREGQLPGPRGNGGSDEPATPQPTTSGPVPSNSLDPVVDDLILNLDACC